MGDIVLFEVTKIITNSIRNSDIFGRFGGEEFLLICPETDREQAFLLAEKLRKDIENYNFDKIGQKTISLGISQFVKDDTPITLIKKADIALYESKNNGRNKATIYSL
jgi:diguanylate cyclase (GGDEF)-like protein